MNLPDLLHEMSCSVGRMDRSHVRQARLDLEALTREMSQQLAEGQLDATNAQVAKVAIARHGLEIQQHLIPALNEFVTKCFEFAGTEGLRVVCAGVRRTGTGRDGMPLGDIPSDFTLPEGY